MASSRNKKPRLSPLENTPTAFLKARGFSLSLLNKALPSNMPHCSSSSSSSSADFDCPPSPPTTAMLDNVEFLAWDRNVTDSICQKSGVMHFPKPVGKKIPGSIKTITLRDNAAHKSYQCSIHSADRSAAEKYLVQKELLRFVKEQHLKVGDILKLRIGGTPLNLFVDVVRV